MVTSSQIIYEIERQWQDLLRVRSMFPTMTDDLIGKCRVCTAPFYRLKGLPVELLFKQPLTRESIEEINQIGQWINESYVIRLCAVLEFHRIIPREGQGRINKCQEGHEEVDILRRVRNELVHRSGQYNPQDPESRKLYERMVEKFSLNTEGSATATTYPVHIDRFLEPITDACKRYVRGSLPSCSDRSSAG